MPRWLSFMIRPLCYAVPLTVVLGAFIPSFESSRNSGNVEMVVAYVVLFVLIAGFVAEIERWARARVPVDQGRCAQCGYDLRATPDRCPQCGTAAADARGGANAATNPAEGK